MVRSISKFTCETSLANPVWTLVFFLLKTPHGLIPERKCILYGAMGGLSRGISPSLSHPAQPSFLTVGTDNIHWFHPWTCSGYIAFHCLGHRWGCSVASVPAGSPETVIPRELPAGHWIAVSWTLILSAPLLFHHTLHFPKIVFSLNVRILCAKSPAKVQFYFNIAALYF